MVFTDFFEKSLLKCGEDLLGPSSSSPPPPPVPLGGKRKEEELGGSRRLQLPSPSLDRPPLSPEVTEEKVWKQKRGREEEGKCGQSTKIQKWRERGRERKEGERRKFVFQKEKCWGTESGAGGKIFNLAPFGMEKERDF